MANMNPSEGGQDPKEAQRQAAARLARQQVLSSYKRVKTIVTTPQEHDPSKPMPVTNVDESTWKQYHSAWSNYYQKYYHEYYNKAAGNFARTERAKAEEAETEAANLRKKYEKPLTPLQQMRIQIRDKAAGNVEKIRKSHHFIPIVVGLVIILSVLFLEYNRNIAAPIIAYISPGNVSAAEISEIDPTVTANPGPEPRLIIPKINVAVPVHFGIPNDTNSLNWAMARGVAQFAIPGANAMPGQNGNLVISGHSASDIYSNHDFKFIFAALPRLEPRDLIHVNYESQRFTYSVTGSRVVAPNDVKALVLGNDKPMLTLITCVPLGTSRNRLLVFAEQISPDPNAAETPEQPEGPQVTQAEIPANPPTFIENIWNWLTGQGD